MSDAGRKNISTKVEEAVKPDSEKSILEKGKEQVTDTLDKAAGNTVPDNQKSFTQTVADNFQKGADEAKDEVNKKQAAAEGEGKTLAETAQEYVDAAKEEIGKAAEYVSGVVTGATEGAQTGADSTKK
ncbi:HSP12 12 kDa heat shock protein [Candida maltosa Xu316]|uniref:Heat shock protein, putative (Glucose and lipid-regulated protein, putative) n=1 Tax=Candida maltosa (strain Xu316) TaxID=1245528 RepID=M3INK4_CANMX|nr:Heat shock protein, putative (Glucose and lipid-regulated protein, putative) [Candida maltosa Xu316]